MSLTAKDVAEIMRLLEDSSFDTLDLEVGDMKLSLRRSGAGIDETAAPAKVARPKSKTAAAPAPAPRAKDDGKRDSASSAPNVSDVPSPLLGVFYRAPKPGEAPFVEVGSKVEPDTVIAIIEVMKLMNSVRAGVRGEVVEIPAQNGSLVEYGETLIRVRKE